MFFNKKHINFSIAIFFIILNYSHSSAQNYIDGYVYDDTTKEPIEAVSIISTLSGKWAISDKKGYFKIPFSKEYNIVFKILGKEEKTIEGISDKNITNLKIYLKDKDLRLEEVMVTAGGNSQNKVNSSIVLDKYAISQTQAFSLAEILQQLPGEKIIPINLNSPKTISLRTANSKLNNRFGVSFILDDMPLSNDENMNQFREGLINNIPETNVNDGYDLRNIPASNIEKIEVIGGIPDAKYGNATSGIIKIDRQAGVSPFRVNSKINGGILVASIDKGFKINDKWGNLSLSLDYLNSNADPRDNLEDFTRITTTGIWSVSLKNKYKNSLSITLQSNIDDLKVDKEFDSGSEKSKYSKDRGFSISNRGSFNINHKLLDYIDFQIGSSYSKSESYSQWFINDGGKVVPIALETALMPGVYTPVAYFSKTHVFSEPFNINGRIAIGKEIRHKSLSQKLSLGTDFKYSMNYGKGRMHDSNTAYTQVSLNLSRKSANGVRPLDYGKYVIPRRLFGVYFQNDITYSLKNKRKIFANIGLRYDNQNGFSSFGPRINTAYELTKNIKIRGGVGFLSKAPSLVNIFPGDKYFDVLVRDIRTNYYSFNLVQTYVKKIPENPLESSKMWKYEMGADIKTSLANINITAYYNKMKDGFNSIEQRELYDFPIVKFDYPNGVNNPPSYSISGYEPFVVSHTLSKNGGYSIDKGIEIFTNFKKIKSLNTSFSLIGNYVLTETGNSFPLIIKTQDALEKEYVYGYYQQQPTKNDMLNFRLVSTYHSSDLGLLISITSEFFIHSISYATINDIYPYGYENIYLKYTDIKPSERTDKRYQQLWLEPSNATKDIKTPFYSNYHLRVTKEMLNGVSLSFYATNFLNYTPIIEINGRKKVHNSNISFGGSIKYIF